MERGVRGSSVVLDVMFYRYPGGPKVDDDRYSVSGTLPSVSIISPQGEAVVSGGTSFRESVGFYSYVHSIASTAEISDSWKIIWNIRINDADLTFEEYFTVLEPGDAGFGDDEQRIGFAFNNPDLVSDHHAPGWGLLVTPDELRYVVLFGTKLVSPDANQTYDDNMLQYFIDNAIASVERDLDIDLLPRVSRHQNRIDSSGNEVERTDIPDDEITVRESGYPYRPNPARNYLYTQLRRRPLRRILSARLVDPVMNDLIDIYAWRHEKKGFESAVSFFPNSATFASYPFFAGGLTQIRYPFNNFPDALLMDYETGFERASEVPGEFRDVIRWTAGMQLLEDFGDGKSPGIASASANLVSISEAFSTTQSATNSLYGARIEYYRKHLKEWYTRNAHKYRRNFIGTL